MKKICYCDLQPRWLVRFYIFTQMLMAFLSPFGAVYIVQIVKYWSGR